MKKVPSFTSGVRVKGNPVTKVSRKAVTVEVTVAVAKRVFPLTFAAVRTAGPIVRTQYTAKKAATLVTNLAPIAAAPGLKFNNVPNPPTLHTMTDPSPPLSPLCFYPYNLTLPPPWGE